MSELSILDEERRRVWQAEALSEAADDVETALLALMVPETVRQSDVVDYLRKRAARIARGNA